MLNSFYLEELHFFFDYEWATGCNFVVYNKRDCIMIDHVAHTKTLFHAIFWSCIQLSFGYSMSYSLMDTTLPKSQ